MKFFEIVVNELGFFLVGWFFNTWMHSIFLYTFASTLFEENLFLFYSALPPKMALFDKKVEIK